MSTGDSTIEELARLAAAGDQTALADAFEHFRPRLKRMVVLRTDPRIKTRIDASDVLQEAFVEIARRSPKHVDDGSTPLFVWLRTVTGDCLARLHRVHLGTAKRNAAREVVLPFGGTPGVSSVFLASQLAGQFTSADHGLIQEEVEAQLQEALNAMDDNDREILAMRHFEELSTDEIAVILNLTKSGVLKRYTRAARRLRDALKGKTDLSEGT